ncbi:hypothetical protein GCM10009590_22160 [Brachybacterium alimentarium]
MDVDLQAHTDFLLDRIRLVLARLTGLQVGFVLVLAVIHETGDRRVRAGRDLDEIEIGFRGETQCVLDADLTDLLAGGPDQKDLGDPDLTIDALFADVGSSPWFESDKTKGPRFMRRPQGARRRDVDRALLPGDGHGCPAAIMTQRRFVPSRRAQARIATRWEGTPLEERCDEGFDLFRSPILAGALVQSR